MHCAVILQTGPKIGGIKAKFLQSGFKLICSLYGRIYVWPLIQKKVKTKSSLNSLGITDMVLDNQWASN